MDTEYHQHEITEMQPIILILKQIFILKMH